MNLSYCPPLIWSIALLAITLNNTRLLMEIVPKSLHRVQLQILRSCWILNNQKVSMQDLFRPPRAAGQRALRRRHRVVPEHDPLRDTHGHHQPPPTAPHPRREAPVHHGAALQEGEEAMVWSLCLTWSSYALLHTSVCYSVLFVGIALM